MSNKQIVNCKTGQITTREMTPEEEARFSAVQSSIDMIKQRLTSRENDLAIVKGNDPTAQKLAAIARLLGG